MWKSGATGRREQESSAATKRVKDVNAGLGVRETLQNGNPKKNHAFLNSLGRRWQTDWPAVRRRRRDHRQSSESKAGKFLLRIKIQRLSAASCEHVAPKKGKRKKRSSPAMAVIRRVWESETRAWLAGNKADAEVTVLLLYSGNDGGKPGASFRRRLSS